jgi:hypothetical protein
MQIWGHKKFYVNKVHEAFIIVLPDSSGMGGVL